ncbi:MAG: sulfotransferase family protein [Flavobacterium nitrogenifigens]|uniref:sulfotransferase family protein n=1 Tax=Flavobacterium nitrogenifigens TaxID=1617283 RepID=UPI0028098F72|nr:sulfotransferase family protein [Flavobacterium nitrogenifigens]MDQ8012896.1 sulfotransferase family protein [Flavobacterium nitrogenifigens]
MENVKDFISNWIPIKLIEKENEVYFEWIYFSNIPFADPFFEETIAKCRSHSYNSKRFKLISTVENLVDWSKELDFVELKGLVFHVSRCGSTMLSQSLATSAENIMVSEAPIIDEILRSDFFDEDTKTVLLESVIRLLGQKRFPEQKNLIIKLDAWSIFKASYLRSVFPEIPFALLYRNPGEVLRSHQKQAGMHMVPNIIPSSVFGITSKEIQELSLQQYQALVLEKYFQGFLDFYEIDSNVIMLNYNDGMKNVIERFISFIDVDFSENEINLMLERLKKHSKNENAVFTGDSYKDDLLSVDLDGVNLLHEKLNANFIEDLAR